MTEQSTSALVPSVLKAISILELIGSSSEPLTLAEICRGLEMPKSSAFGICRTLVSGKMLHQGRDGSFTLGLGIVQLAARHLAQNDLAQAFASALDLQEDTPRFTTQLAVLDGKNVVYLARSDGQDAVPLASNTGKSLPATTTAAGKAMLSLQDPMQVHELFADPSDFVEFTPSSIKDIGRLLSELATARVNGYAVDRGETISGVLCVAAPVVKSPGREPICAVSITTFDPGDRGEGIATLGNEIITIASQVADFLPASAKAESSAESVTKTNPARDPLSVANDL